MAISQATYEAATNFELCVWVWAAVDCRLQTTTEDSFWIVRVLDERDGATLIDTIRVPTRADRMPDFSHPEWPLARAALEQLRHSG